MKKRVAFILLFVLTMVGTSARASEVVVSTAQEFAAAVAADASAHIRLVADLDMTGFSTITATFRGTITGTSADGTAAYRFKNLSQPLFASMNNATVSGVGFTDCDIMFTSSGYGAVLAKEATGTTFSNIVLINIHVFAEYEYAAALVAKANDCTFDGIICKKCRVNTDSRYAGAVTAYAAKSTFKGCTAAYDTKIFADGRMPDAMAGSIAGYADACTITDCLNMGLVGGNNDQVGGLVGFAQNNTQILSCDNAGLAVQMDEEKFDTLYTNYLKAINDTLEVKGIQGGFDDTAWDWTITKVAVASGGVAVVGLGLAATLFFLEVGSTSAIVEGIVIGGVATGGIGFVVALVAAIALPGVAIIYAANYDHDELGGICGSIEGGAIAGCTNYGSVIGPDAYVGGIVGLAAKNANVSNCMNSGIVQGDDNTGGLVGRLNNASSLVSSLNTGDITGDSPTGPVYGGKDNDATVYNTYYQGTSFSDQGIQCAVTEQQLKSGYVAYWLNEGGRSDCWRQDFEKNDIPTLDTSFPAVTPYTLPYRNYGSYFAINTVSDLKSLAESVNDGTVTDAIVDVKADLSDDESILIPIGTEAHPFRGVFRGNGHTISKLHLTSDTRGLGLIGITNVRTGIYDIHIARECTLVNTEYGAGSIVGRIGASQDNSWLVIDGCSSRADVTARFNASGILGNMASDKCVNTRIFISNCFYKGSLTPTSTNNSTGESSFICGYGGKKLTVENCFTEASFKGSNAAVAFQEGKAFARADNPVIRNCYQFISTTEGITTNPAYMQTDVETYTQDDSRKGFLTYKLNGSTNDVTKGLRFEKSLGTEDWMPSIVPANVEGKGVYYVRTITNTLGTIVLPYDVVSTADVTFYTLSGAGSDGSLNFQSVETLPAGTPALFRAAQRGTLTFVSCGSTLGYTVSEKSWGDWTMKGNLSSSELSFSFSEQNNPMSRLYYISKGKVMNAMDNLNIGEFRAYLEGPTYGGSNSIAVRLDGDEVTRIEWSELDEADGNAHAVYDLQGRRVSNPQQGIYVVDGKKVWMK